MGKSKKIKGISAVPTVKILAKTRNEKGELFEKLMKTILDNLGYTEFQTRIHKTGAEIDIKAKHKVTRESIICECKAHKELIDSNDLKKFFGQLNKERARKKRSIGLFFSISGFSGTALEWYEELDNKVKEYFILRDDKKVLELLREAKIIKSDDLIEHEIKNRIPYELESRYLTYSKHGFNWIQIISLNNKPKFYAIVDYEGMIIPNWICEDLGKMDKDLKGKRLINLQAREKVLLNLLDMKEKDVQQISKEIKESRENAKLALEKLFKEDLVNKKERKDIYFIKNEFHNFLILAKEFLFGNDRISFATSVFYQENINESLIDHIKNRLRITFSKEFSEVIERAIKISPSTLKFCLFGDIDQYLFGLGQIKKYNLGKDAYEFWTNITIQSFINDIIKNLCYDLEEKKIDDLLNIYKINGFFISNEIRIAAEKGIYLQALAGQPILRMKAVKGTYEKGMLLSVSTIEALVEAGLILSNMDLEEMAIKCYDQTIDNTKDNNAKKIALNNKGVSLNKLKNHKNALECFDKAIYIDKDFKEAWANKGLAHIYLEEFPEAEHSIKRAIEIDSSYPNSYIYMAILENKRGNKELVFDNLTKVINISNDFKQAIGNDKNFENLWDDPKFKEITQS